MMTRAEKEGEGKRKREHRHGPPTFMLLREPLSRSQSVACAKVQAGAFKARASLAPAKKLAQRLDSLVRVSRRVEKRSENSVHVSCSITGGARNGRYARTHVKHLRMNPVVHAFSGSRADTVRTIMARSSSWDVNWRSPM